MATVTTLDVLYRYEYYDLGDGVFRFILKEYPILEDFEEAAIVRADGTEKLVQLNVSNPWACRTKEEALKQLPTSYPDIFEGVFADLSKVEVITIRRTAVGSGKNRVPFAASLLFADFEF